MNPDIAVGRSFPDVLLPGHTRRPRRLPGPQGTAVVFRPQPVLGNNRHPGAIGIAAGSR